MSLPPPPRPVAPTRTGATEPRRTHPVTPVVHAVRMLPVAIVIGVAALGQFVAQVPVLAGALGVIVVAVLVAVITCAFQFLSWQRFTFWFDDEGDLRLASGVLTRRERRLQLSRLQGVEVVQPLVARLFGMAGITVEVGGVGDSKAQIQYLTLTQAQELRNETIARAAGLHPDVGEAPQSALVTGPARDLAWSLALRGSTVLIVLVTVMVVTTTWISAGPVGLFFVLVGGIPLVMIGVEFARYYDFTVAESADGLRLRSGLFQVQSQTIPPGRVQAIEFEQSWLWRRRDWVRVRLNVAGMGAAGDDDRERNIEQVLLPVAPYTVAVAVVERVLPGVDARAIPLTPAPPQAARRAWIQFRRLGVGHTDQVFVTERGRFVNRLAVVPHARTQSVRVRQGPWQRRLGLASMYVDSVPGPVSVQALHRGAAEARELAEAQNARALAAVSEAGNRRWMQPGPQGEQS